MKKQTILAAARKFVINRDEQSLFDLLDFLECSTIGSPDQLVAMVSMEQGSTNHAYAWDTFEKWQTI